MAEKNPSILSKKIIFKKFKLGKLIFESNFSWVYEGKNIIKNIPVAIKIEKANKYNLLESEAYILTYVKGFGIPEIISFGKYGSFKILIEELLGKNIHTLWESCPFKKDHLGGKSLYIKDICLFAIQAIERLKYIHNKNIIHHDIKPKNFVVGRNDQNIIYLIDFGFAKQYRSSRTGKHIRFTSSKNFAGSLFYASLNSIKGLESSRRDDLESLGHVLIFLAKGGFLPFNKYPGIYKMEDEIRKKLIKKIRLETTDENLCKGLPNEFIDYMKYTKKLNFEQEPDYNYLSGLFQSILSKTEFKRSLTFFWIKQKNENEENKIFSPEAKVRNNSKSNSINKLYNKIKNSLRKKSINIIKENHNYTEDNIIDSDNKKTELCSRLNTKRNYITIVSTTNTNYNKEMKKIYLLGNNKDNMNIKPFSAFSITRSRKKIKSNMNNNKNKKNIRNLLIYNSNEEKNINSKELINSTYNSKRDNKILYNKIYNNTYFIENIHIKQNMNINNSELKNKNNESNYIPLNSERNNMKLNKNIIYKPIYPKIKKPLTRLKLNSNLF